jgi:hypothetical protein
VRGFFAPENKADLYKLPSGDWIHVASVRAARVSEKATRAGEIGGTAYVNADGSWYSVVFDNASDAHEFVDALVTYRNEVNRRPDRALSRSDAADLVADLRAKAEP